MARPVPIETIRKAMAGLTGVLEDAALIAARGQAARDITHARRTCDRLIEVLQTCLARLQRLRRRLG